MVVVELVGSRNGANAAQLGTLDSLKLRKRGTVATVCYREQTTPGMLHRVRHLIEVRPHNNETFL
jgi:ribosomal protein L30/L7E